MESMMTWILLAIVVQQGSGDALDLMCPADYWKAKQVEMTVETLVKEIETPADGKHPQEETPQAVAARRLMAIRALGDLKSQEALPHLRLLLQDKSPFAAEYAREAIARIEGKPAVRPAASPEKMKSDLALLPAGCGVVAQAISVAGEPVPFARVLEVMKAVGPKDEDVLRFRICEELRDLTARVGNFRFEGVTLGVSGDIGDETGFVVLIGRGLYDRDAVAAAIKKAIEAPPDAGEAREMRFAVETVEGVDVYYPEDGLAFACPSNDRLIMVAGSNREQIPVKEVLAAIKTGKGGLETDKALADLLQATDRSKPLWGVARVTESYREADVLSVFDSLALSAEVKDDRTHLTLTARGKDAEEVKRALETFEAGRKELLENAKEAPEGEAASLLKDLLAFVESVESRQDGADVTITAVAKGRPLSVIGALPLYFIVGVSHAFQDVAPFEPNLPPGAGPDIEPPGDDVDEP